MAIAMDTLIRELRDRMEDVDIKTALTGQFDELVRNITGRRLNVSLLWNCLLNEYFSSYESSGIVTALRSESERSQIKKLLKLAAAPRLVELIRRMLDMGDDETTVATVDAELFGIDPAAFIETYYYDDLRDDFTTFMDPGKLVVRIYYSLDHTLGEGAEATLRVALLGAACKVTDDPSVPLKERYVPLRDGRGRLVVSRDVMVAKKPRDAASGRDGSSSMDLQRHKKGSINLRDLTLPQYYTEESKKLLPGLWSLPRFTDFGEDGSLYYEYVDGVPLQAVLDEANFDLLARFITLKHMAQTLHYMHSAGYVHNDVKPQNVVVSQQGIATIIDFGLTEKYIESYKTPPDSRTRKIVGTPLYMSPEQVTKRSSAELSIGHVRYAAPIRSLDELAYLRREVPHEIVEIDGIHFREVSDTYPGPRTPFFHDSYLHKNFFCDKTGNPIPVTGKSDVFSLGVNILRLTTGLIHLKNRQDVKAILRELSEGAISVKGVASALPEPLNVSEQTTEGCYKEKLEKLINRTLERHPHNRPPAREVAATLQEIVWLYFGGDRTFFSTFDDECTYLRNRLYRNQH